MRSDMAKVIVERPRRGGGVGFPRRRRWLTGDMDELPAREAFKSRHFKRRKYLNENLAPLRRFLRSKIGLPWNSVKAEISEQVSRDTAVQFHVWQHLNWDVTEDVIVREGLPCYLQGGGTVRGFYVHPESGVLLEMRGPTKRERRLRRLLEELSADRIVIHSRREFLRLECVWYLVVFARCPTTDAAVWDVLKKQWVAATRDEFPRGRYAKSKRQLDKREIQRVIMPKLLRQEAQRAALRKELFRLQRGRGLG